MLILWSKFVRKIGGPSKIGYVVEFWVSKPMIRSQNNVESRICWLIRFEKIPIISKKQLSTWSGHKRHKLMEIDRGEENQNVLQSLGLKIEILKV